LNFDWQLVELVRDRQQGKRWAKPVGEAEALSEEGFSSESIQSLEKGNLDGW
jgi:hypothetical protein